MLSLSGLIVESYQEITLKRLFKSSFDRFTDLIIHFN